MRLSISLINLGPILHRLATVHPDRQTDRRWTDDNRARNALQHSCSASIKSDNKIDKIKQNKCPVPMLPRL